MTAIAETARTTAKFPEVAASRGHYESFYVKASDPAGGRAVWLRHTVHQRPGQARTGSLWLTLFEEGQGPRAVKATYPADSVTAPPGGYIGVGDALLVPGKATGRMQVDGLEASWDLAFSPGDEALWHLPADLLYKAPLPKTKALSPHPGARWSGTVRLGDRELRLDAWPGMIGHNWGREHAERWVWLHADPFEGHEGAWLDIALGRILVGPWLTPWVGNGMLTLDGVRHRLGGIPTVRKTSVREEPTRLEFTLPGKGIEVHGRVSEPGGDAVAWVYADPDGGTHHTVNCSIATMELDVRRDGAPPVTLVCRGAAAYELGMRDTDHGIPLQPYDDGR